MAKRCYSLAADKKFVQGRKTRLIAGVILYSLCRQNKTMHLLIDFSDVLQTNLYVLGSLYIKLIKLLHLKIPQIDPSLFIQRFCNKLKFGNKTTEIANSALKILQSMKRNWLHLGRRPSGLCGAAILIAAKCHQFDKSINDIIDVVHVCDDTVKKRITEFSKTPTSKITKEEFDQIKIENEVENYVDSLTADAGMDPPSFIQNRQNDSKTYEKDVLEKTREIERATIQKFAHMQINENHKISLRFIKTTDKINSKRHILDNSKYIYKDSLKKKKSRKDNGSENSDNDSLTLGEDDELSSLNDTEIEQYCCTAEEEALKTKLWEIVYEDWIREQKLKQLSNTNNNEVSLKRKRKKSTNSAAPGYEQLEPTDHIEAMRNSKKFPKKTDYDNLSKILT